VKAVGGDHVEVHTLIGSGSDPHTYQPSPKDVAKLHKQEAVFLVGHGLEQPLEAVLKGYKGKTLALAEALEGEEGKHDDHDEHEGHGHDEDKEEHDNHKRHDHGEHDEHGAAIEWAGAFSLEAGSYTWSFAKVQGEYADPAMKMLYLPSKGEHPIEVVEAEAGKLFAGEAADLAVDGTLSAGALASLQFDASSDSSIFNIVIAEKGTYVFFAEHMPYEFEADEHFFKTAAGADVEPIAEEPESGHDHHHGHDHGEHDPHIWLNVQKALAAIHLIEEQLSALHPEDAKLFSKNAEAYEKELKELEHWIKESVETIPEAHRIVITGHDAFGHYAKAYGFRNLGSLNPSMSTAHISPGPKHLGKLGKLAKAARVPAVFPETGHSPKLIQALAREAGIAVAPALTVDNLGSGEASTYLGFMRHNTEIIVEALGGKVSEDHDHDHDH
jgi:zinc/manganese transport system substrate-binding protein